jgi:hypothetical protein
MAFAGALALVQQSRDRAVACFAEAWRQARSDLDRLWACRIETLAWEWAGDAEGLDAVAGRFSSIEHQAPMWSAWGTLAPALAAFLRADWETAAELGERALAAASAGGEMRVAWRASRVTAGGLVALSRVEEAEDRRRDAASIVRSMASSLPDERLRASFTSRPDVAELIGTS